MTGNHEDGFGEAKVDHNSQEATVFKKQFRYRNRKQMKRTTFVGVSGAGLTSLLLSSSFALATSGGPTNHVIQPEPGGPLPGLTQEQIDRYWDGREAFQIQWDGPNGLGPVFNQNSCSSCHNVPRVGGSGTAFVTRFGTTDENGNFDPLSQYGGSLLQDRAIEGIPSFCEQEVPEAATITQMRITNLSIGIGLVEAIPDSQLTANAPGEGGRAPSQNVNGRVNWVPLLEDLDAPQRVGRMGWKAQLATVMSFSADASLMEMGLTSDILPDPVAPWGDESLLEDCDIMGPPHPQLTPDENGITFLDRITDFQRFSAPPPQWPKEGMTGEDIFVAVGCADCHIPSFITANDPALEDALRNQVIKPYSDFLLHDMGMAGDPIEMGGADMGEVRTPGLWGVSVRDPLWHDGRVVGGSLYEKIWSEDEEFPGIIALHNSPGSSAAYSAQQALALNENERQHLVDFLSSLGQMELDANQDFVIDEVDLEALIGCFTGTRNLDPTDPDYITVDDFCTIFDMQGNGDVDEFDFTVFTEQYQGSFFLTDCDLWDALVQNLPVFQPDANIEVQLPVECGGENPCPADLTRSGVVNVFDLLALLEAWGPCPDCPADLTGDGVVNVFDLLDLLEAWGQCPE